MITKIKIMVIINDKNINKNDKSLCFKFKDNKLLTTTSTMEPMEQGSLKPEKETCPISGAG